MARMLMGTRSIDHWRSILAVAATVALALGTVQTAPAAADAAPVTQAPVTQTFTCTGSQWAFPVPDGVTSLRVVAVGAPGATLSVGPNTGGRGARVTADVAVTPGQLLRVNVGCPGSGAAGGFNGGGTANSALHGGAGAGGGGASDIRTISRFDTGSLASRLIVAGGGGGEGGTNEYGNSTSGGAGGNAGADGGNAGGTTNSRGRAGTPTAGGAGGSATGTLGAPQPGSPGQAGTGGNGGAYGVNTPGRGGGGGGGGLFGGGGGGGGGILNSTAYGGGGGGGGSSLVPPGGTLTVAPAGTAPSVTITYVPPPPECSDGLDNDGDGLIDFPADPGCTDADDDRELDPTGNDDFQDAEVLTGSSASATGSNVDASMQTGEPDHRNGNGSHSIWYRWTAPGSGATTIELCGSDFDTVLAVYTGNALDVLTLVVENDDSSDEACGTVNSRVVFDATRGVTYHIAVDGWGDNTGNVSLSLAGPSTPGYEFVPVAPCAVFDTRFAAGDLAGKLAAGASRAFRVTGELPGGQGGGACPALPADAVAVQLNLVALAAEATGNLQIAADGVEPQGGAVDFVAGVNNSNALPVQVNPDSGAVRVFNNAAGGGVHVRGVVLGYYTDADPAGLELVAVTPCAVFDTRFGQGGFAGKLAGGASRTFQVSGAVPGSQGGQSCAAPPADAVAVELNLVAVAAEGPGNLQVAAAGVVPGGGVVNFAAGANNSNALPVGVNPDSGAVEVFNNTGGGNVHVRGVVLGYYTAAEAAGLEFLPVAPCAVFDTRFAAGDLAGKLAGGTSRVLQITGTVPDGQGGQSCQAPPADAAAVELNLVALQAEAPGNLQLAAAGVVPNGGVVNFAAGADNSNALPVEVADGAVEVTNTTGGGNVHVRGVALGYYVPGGP